MGLTSLNKEMHEYLLSFDDSSNYSDTSHPADIVPHELSGNPAVVEVNLMSLENWYREYEEKRRSSVLFKASNQFVGSSSRLLETLGLEIVFQSSPNLKH